MTLLYLEALVAIGLSLAVLMAGAWVVQQKTGNSGWVDTVWTFALGAVGAAQRAVAGGRRRAAMPRQMLVAGAGRPLVGAARRPHRRAQPPASPTIRAMPA